MPRPTAATPPAAVASPIARPRRVAPASRGCRRRHNATLFVAFAMRTLLFQSLLQRVLTEPETDAAAIGELGERLEASARWRATTPR